MKKYMVSLILVFNFFSSVALADVVLPMEGSGSTTEAVTAFDKAVTANGGTVDKNAQTDFASAGNFESFPGEIGSYRAKMYAEEKEGKVSIRMVFTTVQKNLVSNLFTAFSNAEMNIAIAIRENMKKDGYILSDRK